MSSSRIKVNPSKYSHMKRILAKQHQSATRTPILGEEGSPQSVNSFKNFGDARLNKPHRIPGGRGGEALVGAGADDLFCPAPSLQ